jgi:hypothetical protein
MRALLILPLALCAACSFEVSGLPFGDLGGRDLSVPDSGADRPMSLDGPTDAAPDLTLPGPDLSRFDLANFLCPGGNPPQHIGELTEGDVTRWGSFIDPAAMCQSPNVTVNSDTTLFTTGTSSIRLDSDCSSTGLIYPKDENASWDLSPYTTLTLDIAGNMPMFSMSSPRVYLVAGTNNYFLFSASKNLITPNQKFTRLTIPLDGSDPNWPRQSVGTVTLKSIQYVAVTWQDSKPTYSVWLDNLAFLPGPFVDCSP